MSCTIINYYTILHMTQLVISRPTVSLVDRVQLSLVTVNDSSESTVLTFPKM